MLGAKENKGDFSKTRGYLIIFATFAVLVLYLYVAIVLKMLPYTSNAFLNYLKDDEYYCFAIPLALLPTLLIVYLNWLSIKVYESN